MTSPNKQSFIEFVKERLGKDFQLAEYQKEFFAKLEQTHSVIQNAEALSLHQGKKLEWGIDTAKEGGDKTGVVVIMDEASILDWSEVQEKLYKVLGSGQEPRIVYLGERHDSLC